MVKKITQKPVNVTANEVSAYLKAQGKYIRAKRKELRLTQVELGEMTNVDHSLIAKLEVGVTNVSTQNYLAVIRALQIDQHQLVDFIQEEMDNFDLLNGDESSGEKLVGIKRILKLPKNASNEEVILELAKKVLSCE